MRTPLYQPRPNRRFTWSFSLRTFFVLLTVFCVWLAYYEREHRNLRTYYFTARITSNGGITPFKVGTVITGYFTYDMTTKDVLGSSSPQFGRYISKRHQLVVEYDGDQFIGAGQIMVSAGAFAHSEIIGAAAWGIELPQGWRDAGAGKADVIAMNLQNAPPRGAVSNKGIPKEFDLSKFVDTHEIVLQFGRGVQFPGGSVTGLATVKANVETIEAGPF